MAFPKIAIVVINYRTVQLTLDCLASLEPEVHAHAGMHVIVLDSASGDGSADILEKQRSLRRWNDWLSLVRLDENRGFSAGNNAGIVFANERARCDAFLLLNSDTLVRPGAIGVLGDVLAAEPSIGLVGPRLEWPEGDSQMSCFRTISPVSEFLAAAKTGALSRLFPGRAVPILDPPTRDANGAHGPDPGHDEIDWISFACVLIRSEALGSIGPMDESFFMYFEDVDYCRRARNAGWQIAYAPAARVVHLRGGKTQETFAAEERGRRPTYYYRSRARYLGKYYGPTGPCRANLCWLLGRGVSLARELAGNKVPHTVLCEAVDIWKGSLPAFVRRGKASVPDGVTSGKGISGKDHIRMTAAGSPNGGKQAPVS